MATKRTKVQALPEITAQQAEQLLSEFAQNEATCARITAEMDEEMAAIREQYRLELEPFDQRQRELQAQLQSYAERNKEQLFTKKRSVQMISGLIGFRNGTPKAKNLKGYTWASVLELCKAFAPAWVRTKEELARDLMIAERNQEGKDKLLEKVGVEIVTDETFFIETKKEEVAA